ncbi:hypothetical protein GCM10022383_08820 [Microbacterium soli]|uniref:4Fe-4S ferredoxin-type domain-containing protein n=1 Tax=Microbacterium soli TaxID=446075 RepID=A0ABP7MY32_9MICO
MENQAEETVELDGVEYALTFVGDLDDEQRVAQGMPPRGTACGCQECSCANEADLWWGGSPICGCCLADCPDVHPGNETHGI